MDSRSSFRSICTSVNDVCCHGVPDTRPLEEGDIISIDVSVYRDGFHGDTCDTVYVTDDMSGIDKDSENLIAASKHLLTFTIDRLHLDMPFSDIGVLVEDEQEKSFPDYSICTRFAGHGVGQHFHMAPQIPFWSSKHGFINLATKRMSISPGQAFTIEPIVIEGKTNHVDVLSDGWTVISSQDHRSAQHEHTVWMNPFSQKIEVLT